MYEENHIPLNPHGGRFNPARLKFNASYPTVSPLYRFKCFEFGFAKSVGCGFKDFFLRLTVKCSGDSLKLARKRLEHDLLLPPRASSGLVQLGSTPADSLELFPCLPGRMLSSSCSNGSVQSFIHFALMLALN